MKRVIETNILKVGYCTLYFNDIIDNFFCTNEARFSILLSAVGLKRLAGRRAVLRGSLISWVLTSAISSQGDNASTRTIGSPLVLAAN
jgi:hypothetical protein